MELQLHLSAGLPGQPETILSVSGDVITVGGTAYDLSSIAEGDEATPEGEHPFAGTITRKDGEIVASVMWFYDAFTAEPDQGAGPVFWTGTDPVKRKPVEETQQ